MLLLCRQLTVDSDNNAVNAGSFGEERIRVEDVEQDGEERARGVDAQRHPPDQLFVQLLFEVLQDEQADGEAGQRTFNHTKRKQLINQMPRNPSPLITLT